MIVGALRHVDVAFPDLQRHLQAVHPRPRLGTVVVEAQALEAVVRLGALAHLAPVHHHRAAGILGNAIGQ